MIPIGLALVAGAFVLAGTSEFRSLALHSDRSQIVQMTGVGFLFVPLNNAAYIYLPKDQINNATGLFNMLRNEGGSLGIAIVATFVDRRSQFHQSRLVENVVPTNPAVHSTVQGLARIRMVRGGASLADAQEQGFTLMYQTVQEQARILAYNDVFWVFFIMALLRVSFPSVDEKAVSTGEPMSH